MTPESAPLDVIVVGGGLAGLACARGLVEAGLRVRLLEGADEVGGRVNSDELAGFILDHGFQVLLTAYPNCQELLDMPALGLGRFDPGALVQLANNKLCRVADPLRQPRHLLTTALAPIGTLGDKLRVLRLRALLKDHVPARTEAWTAVSAEAWLRAFGFSEKIIVRFFRPFFTGIFLENQLATSAWMLGYTYHYFTRGFAALPAGGMRAIPRQLAANLPAGVVHPNCAVRTLDSTSVTLTDGSIHRAKAVVAAVDGDTAQHWFPQLPGRAWQAAGCYYFAANTSPLTGTRSIWLNATGRGQISQIAVPSDIAAGYAPADRSLISIGVVGADAGASDPEEIRAEAATYFGPCVHDWDFLKSYAIPKALPLATPAALAALALRPTVIDGVHLCGDHLNVGSIDAALASGSATARTVAQQLRIAEHPRPRSDAGG